jgi:site-specific DNA-methyltransferase (adenine-specific)
MTTDYLLANQPDILEVIANLSSDEVFTPPRVVNAVLDMLPAEVWTDPSLRWLDPACKTGVFPREITKRLMVGLADAIPDDAARLEHILANMVFAMAITEITSMMARRTLYCSKDASSAFSVVVFPSESGNVWFERAEHAFDKGRCTECGGTKEQLEKPGRENYAYGFIHLDGRDRIEKEMNMKFDVIVGNPPYQMDGGGGGTNATPLYDVFVEQAKALNPSYISMIIPSRWMAGGRGLDDFRSGMLGDPRIRHLVDYFDAGDLFPGVEIKGGVCYFLWDRDHAGQCSVTVHRSGELEILRKILEKGDASVSDMVSGDTPFGLPSNFKGYRKSDKKPGDVKVFLNENGRGEKWMDRDLIHKNTRLIDAWKVYLPEAYGAGDAWPHQILGQSIIGPPKTVCTQTYLCFGPFGSKSEAASAQSYLNTRFARFLISLRKISQHALRSTYQWVPQQSWDQTWNDDALYKKYGVTKDERAYIESMVREMPA